MPDSLEFPAAISREIWESKYRLKVPPGGDLARVRKGEPASDADLDATFWRVANAVAGAEKGGKRQSRRWAQTFHDATSDFGFLPAGRILAGAGSGRDVTLFNCFVMGTIGDDLGSIFDNLKEAALTMQQGGGIGLDFSTLRPRGALVRSIGADASGPVSFMDVWDAMCGTIRSAGARRGAMMATMRCDHPDIEDFIAAKADARRLRNFNLSVLVTDTFMEAVREDRPWPLVFGGRTFQEVPARALWERIMRATFDYAEPGVIFIDRVNRSNNLAYLETISATNPCGEQPLPPHGACLLGSINLTRFVTRPFAVDAELEIARLEERVSIAVRFLDDVIDISGYPLAAQRHEARSKRRIGLGITGLADALAMMNVRYGTDRAAGLAAQWMAALSRAAYLTSAEIAKEKGSFRLFDRDHYLSAPHVAAHDADVRRAIQRHGIRNGCLTSIAPTGTISLFAGNVSSGIEPMFEVRTRRLILDAAGRPGETVLTDYAVSLFRSLHGEDAPLPAAFVTSCQLSPREHLTMQAAVQRHVDSSISKTINCPAGLAYADFVDIYRQAYELDLKGCTTFRPNAVTGAVLRSAEPSAEGVPAPLAPPEQAPAFGAQNEREEPEARPDAGAGIMNNTPAVVGTRADPAGDVVYLTRPLERAPVLSGSTYKLRRPASDHALYITINDIEIDCADSGPSPRTTTDAPSRRRLRPFEIFINTRNLEHHAWTVALTRMISAVFRRGGDVSFVAEELKGVFDPQGGHWMGGRYVPSLLAAIGEIIETHMRNIGFLTPQDEASQDTRQISPLKAHARSGAGATSGHSAAPSTQPAPSAPPTQPESGHFVVTEIPEDNTPGRVCPRCNDQAFIKREGCWTCLRCGFSRCG